MRKLKLLMAVCALMMGSINADAREDVTSTYLTDAALENEDTNWALVSNGGNHAWNGTNKYHESWHNTFTLTQTTTALPAGYYQLSIQAAVEGGNSTTISLQATSGGNTSVAAYPKYSTADSYANMAAWWAADFTGTGNRNLNRIYTTVYVEEGQTLTATFKQTNAGQWFVYGQMQLHKLTDAEGRYAQMFEAVYNPMTNQDLASGRFKQRFEYYTEATVPAKTLNKTISSLPNGYYNVTFNGSASYTSGRGYSGNTGDNLTYFFANNITTNVTVVDRTNVGNSEFVDYTASNALVSDGNLEFGYSNVAIGANWFTGSVKMIEYLGGCVAADAVALPVSGDMAADTWYYFDIVLAGSDYNATATTLGDIVCTSDGTQLSASATGEVSLTATANSLTATRYYVKSSSANNLVVAAASYSYSVGSAAADISYIQPGNTVTVAYADLSTNDPGATLAKNFSGVTFGGNAIDVTPTANGFTFTVPEVAAGANYTLAIPANAIGYEEGSEYNTAQNITLTTVAVYDGYYYLKTSENKYLSRGGSYNTQAVVDNLGLPVKVQTNASNVTEFIFVDNWFHLFDADNGNLYTDNNTANNFALQATEGGYFIVNKNATSHSTENGKLYLDGNAVKVSISEAGAVWTFEAPATHKTQLQAVKDAQAAAVASAAGISASTVSELTSVVTGASYRENAISITGTGGALQENYQGEATSTTGNELAIFAEETVNGLQPGLYCLTVNAFERITWPDDVYNAGGAAGLTYVYANDQKVQLYSLFDYPSDTELKNTDKVYDGKHYADRTDAAQLAFDAGKYLNKVFVVVTDEGDGTGSIRFGIKKPNRYGNAGSRGAWVCYNNFTLTRYEALPANQSVTITAAGYRTYCSDYALDFSGTGITVYQAIIDANEVEFPKIDDGLVPAGAGVLLKGAANTYEVPVIKTAAALADNDFIGTVEGTTADAGSFVLMGTPKVGFYKAANAFNVGANTAYLPAAASTTRSFIGFDEEVTGIKSLKTVGGQDVLFDLSGRRVMNAQKGLYIMNGKKVVK